MASIAFSTPDSVRYPAVKTPEALAFIAAAEGLMSCPASEGLDEVSLLLIVGGTRDAALTIHLNELADF